MRIINLPRPPQPKYPTGRKPQKEPVPFQMLLPLSLKNTVSGKSDKTREPACIQEMATMFACFKQNDFDQAKCLKEVEKFTGCFQEYKAKSELVRKQEKKGVLIPGEKKLTHRQVNQLMKSFPTLK